MHKMNKTSDVDPDQHLFGSVDPDSESRCKKRREKQSITNKVFFFVGNYIFKPDPEKVANLSRLM